MGYSLPPGGRLPGRLLLPVCKTILRQRNINSNWIHDRFSTNERFLPPMENKKINTLVLPFFPVISTVLYVVIQGLYTTSLIAKHYPLLLSFLVSVILESNTVLLHELCDTTCIQICTPHI